MLYVAFVYEVRFDGYVQIMENFLVACLDYGLQNLSSQQEISTAFAEFSKKFMNAPNEKKTGRIGFFKF